MSNDVSFGFQRRIAEKPYSVRVVHHFVKLFLIVVIAFGLFANAEAQDKAKVVFISGSPSHERMEHEHRAESPLDAEI